MTVLVASAVPATAATQSEFYLNLLRRGVAAYDAARYAEAAKQLRIAAFGLVESVEQYQLAQMYLALTHDKLGQRDRASEAARRVIAAERVQRRYASSAAAVRTVFEPLAARLLTPSEMSMLRGTTPLPPLAPPPAKTATATPTQSTITTPPRTTTQPATQQPSTQQPTTQPATQQPTTQPQQPVRQTAVQPPPAQPMEDRSEPRQTTTPRPATTTPAPATTTTKPPQSKPPVKAPTTSTVTIPASQIETTPPRTTTTTTTIAAPRTFTAAEISTRLASADRALNAANLPEAKRVYRELLGAQGLDHDAMIRVAEGLYRSRDFAGALSAFTRAGTLRRGEEPYRYYIAVAAFETGDIARAKRELAAALPFIEVTPDVARYRTRIEGAQ